VFGSCHITVRKSGANKLTVESEDENERKTQYEGLSVTLEYVLSMSNNASKEDIKQIHSTLTRLTPEARQRFANECKAIEVSKSPDGKGLSTGADIDYHLVNGFLPDELGDDFEKYHEGEADVKISEVAASYKTLRSKGDTALSWSKNPDKKKDGSSSVDRKFLENPIPMIMYLRESGRWWVNGPTKSRHESIEWNRELKSGFYIIDMKKAASFIELKSNNKSDSIIDSQDMYRMLTDALNDGNFVEIPEPKGPVMKLRFTFEFEDEE